MDDKMGDILPEGESSKKLQSLCEHCQYIFDNWEEVVEDEYQARFLHCDNIFALQTSTARGCPLCGQFLRNLASRGELETAQNATIDVFNKGLTPVRSWIRAVSLHRIISSRRQVLVPADCRLLELRFRFEILEEDEEGSEDDAQCSSQRQRTGGWEDAFEDVGKRAPDDLVCKVTLMPVLENLLQQESPTIQANSRDALCLAKTWIENCCELHPVCNASSGYTPTRLLYLDGENVRLCLSSSLKSTARYATLSHCWGSLKVLQLTRLNLRYLLKGLPAGALCKTFQDAVHITRTLGLQYLWIDSLCIVQDDPDDWKQESSLMSRIYSCSHINIAATSAYDGNGGCFFDRDPRRVWRYRISTSVHGLHKSYECIEDGGWDACLIETPLASRAWVLQERLLAPRTLHFSETQLFWECNFVTACEVFPDKFPDALTYGDFHLAKQPISRSLWPRIVKIYSTCHLSFSRDKLVAISGIAQTIQVQNADDKYLAGLWQQDMEEQLCWMVRVHRPSVLSNRAPSWSWASVDGIIDYAVPSNHDRYVQILDVDLGPRDPFGEIPEGILKLSCGLLFSGTFDTTHGYVKFGTSQYHVRTCLDDLRTHSGTAFILPVVDGIRSGSKFWRGLLLQATKNRAEYQRIGYFEFDADNEVYDFLIHHCQSQDHQSRSRSGNIRNMGRIITIV